MQAIEDVRGEFAESGGSSETRSTPRGGGDPPASATCVRLDLSVDVANTSVAISLSVPPTELDLLAAQNAHLQLLARRYLNARSGASPASLQEALAAAQDASLDASGDQSKRYELGLMQLERLLTQLAETRASVERGLAPERAKAAAAATRAAAAKAALLRLVSDIAAASTGHGRDGAAGAASAPVVSAAAAGGIRRQPAVSQRLLEYFLASEPGKADQVASLRAQVARLAFRAQRQEAALHRSHGGDALEGAEGGGSGAPRAVDFEQLRMELVALAAKREARVAEVQRLQAKLVDSIQISAHVKQKLYSTEEERAAVGARLSGVEDALAAAKQRAADARRARARLRGEADALRKAAGVVSDSRCQADMKAQREELRLLQARAAEVEARLAVLAQQQGQAA